jgi:dihydropteroate synthase
MVKHTPHVHGQWTWSIRGRCLQPGRRALVMGILNITPDSFSDGGRYLDPGRAVERGLEMVEAGADLVDVGGESTRPGAQRISREGGRERVVPVIRALARQSDVAVSVDTSRAAVAEQALEAGARVINDISALRFDPEMPGLASRSGAGLVLMHMQGTPQSMQQAPSYADVVEEVLAFLKDALARAVHAGISAEQVVLDPGIGFGKCLEHNLSLLRHINRLCSLGRPVLVGASRKSFVGEITGRPVDRRLAGSLAAAAAAVGSGAQVVRVHDVAETVDTLRVLQAIRDGEGA